jgi:ribonuclease HII
MPDFVLEEQYGNLVCGIDEVGRGPLAGPVVAACVYIPPEKRGLSFICGLQDSKKLSRTKLEYFEAYIKEHCIWRVAECTVDEIDRLNILQASLRAMEKCYAAMPDQSISALIDGHMLPPNIPCAAYAIKKGDDRSCSIAAASIIAKLTRDRLMEKLHNEHPQYGWNTNVGYPSPAHKKAILQHGITIHHRRTFSPVRDYIASKASNSV